MKGQVTTDAESKSPITIDLPLPLSNFTPVLDFYAGNKLYWSPAPHPCHLRISSHSVR